MVQVTNVLEVIARLASAQTKAIDTSILSFYHFTHRARTWLGGSSCPVQEPVNGAIRQSKFEWGSFLAFEDGSIEVEIGGQRQWYRDFPNLSVVLPKRSIGAPTRSLHRCVDTPTFQAPRKLKELDGPHPLWRRVSATQTFTLRCTAKVCLRGRSSASRSRAFSFRQSQGRRGELPRAWTTTSNSLGSRRTTLSWHGSQPQWPWKSKPRQSDRGPTR